jgi:hypothetical protein
MAEEAAARETTHRLTRTGITVNALALISPRAFHCTNVRAAGHPEHRALRTCPIRTRAMQSAPGKDRRHV